MKHSKLVIIGAVALSVVAGGVIVSNQSDAKGFSRFEQLQQQNSGFEERAKTIGIEDAKQVEIQRPGNKDAKVKPLESMEGYVQEKSLSGGGSYKEQELLTYEEFLNKYTMFDYNPEISKDRQIWAVVSEHPGRVEVGKNGYVENAVMIKYYDAETGEYYGFRIYSKNKDGMHLSPSGEGVNVKKSN